MGHDDEDLAMQLSTCTRRATSALIAILRSTSARRATSALIAMVRATSARQATSALALSAVLVGSARPAIAQTVWFVDASKPAGGSGSSWANAFDELQPALDASNSGDQIWVARGVYHPTVSGGSTDPRAVRFLIDDGDALYGGFAGHETSLDQRAGLFGLTVLDGDVGVPGDPTDNAYHVVRMVGASYFKFASIDGFTIQNGNGLIVGSAFSKGAGILASAGGSTHGPALTVRNCTVRNNVADTGGGIAAANLARIDLDTCVVRGNFATLNGGGMSSVTAYVVSFNTLWIHNSTAGDGGAAYTTSTSTDWVAFVNDVFRDNSANRGGALGIGGSDFVRGTAVLKCSTLAYNSAQIGGAVYAETTTPAKAQLTVHNSILWANTAPTADQIFGSGQTIDVTRNVVQGGFPGQANLNADPLFFDGPRRDLSLRAGSPACDRGDLTLVPADYFDFDGDGLASEYVPHDFEHTRRFTDDPLAPNTGFTLGGRPMIDLGAFER